jgi:hypothetical protein
MGPSATAGNRFQKATMIRMKIKFFPVPGFIVLVLILGVGAWAFYPRPHLKIRDVTKDKTIFEPPASPGDNLWIVFLNSAEGLPVADHFVLNSEHRIIFTETIYQAPYGGYVHEERAENIGPRTMRISDFEQPKEKITFFAGYTSRHILFLNGRWVPLYDVAQGGDLIQIQVESYSRMNHLMKRITSHD